MAEFYNDKVFIKHEIEHNPKPEDAGRIKVYATIVLPETLYPRIVWPTVLVCSLPAKELHLDNSWNYRWEQLSCLEDEECLTHYQVLCAKYKLTGHVVDVLRSVNYSPDCALSVYITFKSRGPFTAEDYADMYRSRRAMEEQNSILEGEVPILEVEEAIPEEDVQVHSFGEDTIDIPVKPASKFAVDSLPRKVYKKTLSGSNMCTVCLDGFKMGESVVTLPCGHEFGDSCILGWFARNHVCPLCRFELPCED
ncbi:unnamed protein product [Thlaspi arvense]|uniref:RING-type domain-containing protein n=1 Tax=Thlaspi arvense TaxID=13288 RepID=A0AAU9R435_THLAR|nr:unnamed protein product [Thlaspi arvense]